MSLKAFHIFFVSVSFLLALLVSFWAFREYSREQGTAYVILGAGAILFAAALVWYGTWFLGKVKDIK